MANGVHPKKGDGSYCVPGRVDFFEVDDSARRAAEREAQVERVKANIAEREAEEARRARLAMQQEAYVSDTLLASQAAQASSPKWPVGVPLSQIYGTPSSAASAYSLTEKEWNDDLKRLAKEYQWDLSQQRNVSIAVLTLEEANEYLDLLVKDTHGQLSTGKDYTGVGMGLKGAYEVAKELGGWGATAKAVNINGVMNIVVENYKPRYLDLGIRWQEATPQMLKIGHALNTVQGNISFLWGNIFVEIVFSGAVNAVDYMLHDEKTLGEVVGQFTADISKGVVAGVLAQGFTLVIRGVATFVFGASLPIAIGLSIFAVSAFVIGNKVTEIDDHHEYTKPIKKKIEALIDESE
ncbi:hypothetical protein [Vibrio cholerae]|uniref:hypothetical protein n=1 Tax=Vibrio cholerae TaxID=666 RepID=UPI002DB90EBC|nr:hypothetical protein [Vibrio cholerae]